MLRLSLQCALRRWQLEFKEFVSPRININKESNDAILLKSSTIYYIFFQIQYCLKLKTCVNINISFATWLGNLTNNTVT